MKKLTNKRGFTLIEVVLVLAIGGLIFLLAFVAFQQVSRNRRDTERRNLAARMVAELQNYKTNTGSYPPESNFLSPGTFDSVFLPNYMKDVKDVSGATYVNYDFADSVTTPAFSNAGVNFWALDYGFNKKCNGTAFDPGSAPGIVGVRIKLESGIICRDSQ